MEEFIKLVVVVDGATGKTRFGLFHMFIHIKTKVKKSFACVRSRMFSTGLRSHNTRQHGI